MTDGVIVCIGDLHSGGTTAIMPPSFTTEDGLKVKPSRWQSWLWECFQDFCGIVKIASRAAPVFAIIDGDIIEGNHHNTTQLITADETSQTNLAIDTLEPLMQHVTGCAFVRGTPAHAGQASKYERQVASHFRNRGLVLNESGGVMHKIFKRTVFGLRLNVAHHIGTSKNKRLLHSKLMTVIEAHANAAIDSGSPVADYLLRAHVHLHVDTRELHRTRGITLPCWQMPTEFLDKISPDDQPDIGGVIIRNGNVEPMLYPILKPDRLYPAVKLGTK